MFILFWLFANLRKRNFLENSSSKQKDLFKMRHHWFFAANVYHHRFWRWLRQTFYRSFNKSFSLWSWILTLFGYASNYLNKPSKTLAYCNEAVYPFYILHQTITIILGYYLMNLQWNSFYKFSIMTIGTFLLSWVIYEFLIRRWLLVRPLFGLQNKTR